MVSLVRNGSWSVVSTIRAPEYQVNEFLEHYVGLGADRVYVFFDDPEFAAYDVKRFAGKVIAFVCDDSYWETVYKAPPMSHRVGRPDAVEIRQGVNALFAREIMHSEWILHVDVDEFIYAKKNVREVLSVYPDVVFSVLLRTLEAVYEDVRSPGEETKTIYFKKSVKQKELLKELYSDELLKCATNGLWGTIIGKSFIRKHPEVKFMSVHWPMPVDSSLISNVPTYYIDLLHFEGQSYDLFKEKFKLRVFKNVAKHMPNTYKVRLDIIKREYESKGEAGMLEVYKDFYVMAPDKLRKAMDLGVVVRLNWRLGAVTEEKLLLNNPIYDSGARISNWGGTIIGSAHRSYLVYDSSENVIKAATAVNLLAKRNLLPVEIDQYGSTARLFIKSEHQLMNVGVVGSRLKVVEGMPHFYFDIEPQGDYSFISSSGKYISITPGLDVSVEKEKASSWERMYIHEIYPQLS